MSFITYASQFSDAERKLMLDQCEALDFAIPRHQYAAEFRTKWYIWVTGDRTESSKQRVRDAARKVMNERLHIHSTPECQRVVWTQRAPESLQAAVLRVKRESRT